MFSKRAEHTGKEDVVAFWFWVYLREPFDAMYGDLDADFTQINEAQGVSVGDGGGTCIVIMGGHTFEEFPSKFADKNLHDTIAPVL